MMLTRLSCSLSMLMLSSVLMLSSCSVFNPSGSKLETVQEMQVLGYDGPEPSSIPEVNSDPVPYSGPVIVNLVLVENEYNAPVDHQELIINLPEGLKKDFTVETDNFKSTVTINRAEYTNRDHHQLALLPYLEKPYLDIGGSCCSKAKHGGKVNSWLSYAGGINEIFYRRKGEYSTLAIVTPVADIDSIRMMALEDWMLSNDQDWMSHNYTPPPISILQKNAPPSGWNILKDKQPEMIDARASKQRGLEILGLELVGHLNVSENATVSLDPIAVDPEGLEGILSYTHETQTWTSATDEKVLFGKFPGTLAEAVSITPSSDQARSDCVFQLPDGRRGILQETTSSYYNPLIGKTKESFGYTVYLIH